MEDGSFPCSTGRVAIVSNNCVGCLGGHLVKLAAENMTGLVRDTGAEGKVSCENHVIHALGGATWSYLGIYINLPIVGSAYSVVLIEVGDGEHGLALLLHLKST